MKTLATHPELVRAWLHAQAGLPLPQPPAKPPGAPAAPPVKPAHH